MKSFALLILVAGILMAQPTIPPGGGSPPPVTVNPSLSPYVVRGASTPPTSGCGYWANGRLYSTGIPCGQDVSVAWSQITGKPLQFTPTYHATDHGQAGVDALTLAIAQITGLQVALDAKAAGPSTQPTDSQIALWDGITGRLLKALSISGVLKVTNGVPSAVAGSNTDCVHVDGTSGVCGGGNGSSWSGNVDPVEMGTGAASIQPGRVGYGDFTATGATVGTGLAPIWPALETGLVPLAMRVTASDTIRVWVLNESNAAINPATAQYGATAQGGIAAGGDSTTVANSGATGAAVLKSATNVTARKLRAISGLTIQEQTDTIDFTVTGGGGTGLPSMSGHGGKVITNDGVETASWESLEGGAAVLITQLSGKKVFSVRPEVVGFLAGDNNWNGTNSFTGKLVTTPSATQTLIATDPISIGLVSVKQISAASGITLSSAPTIADGDDGQHVWLVNVGSYAIVLQDEANLANSNLCTISDANLTVPVKGAVHLLFNTAAGCWIEVK